MIAKKNLWWACRAAVVVAAAMASLCASANVVINETNFPDANFRAYVKTLPGGGDGVFTDEELAGITEFDCSYKSIASLKGVEHFKLLQNLNCGGNQLTSLDLSQNTALEKLYCFQNQLKSLDVSQNTALTYLNCNSNQLGSLDLSGKTALVSLYFTDNQLESLNVSANTALKNLSCNNNPLTSLDLSNNKALVSLSAKNCARTVPMCYYMENGNKVTVMPVGNDASNPLYADGFRLEKASNWTNAEVIVKYGSQMIAITDTTQAVTYTYNTGLAGKNVTFTLKKSAQYGGECLFINEENFPDANFRAYVSTLQGGGDGVFTPEELAAITKVDCSSKKIASLKGVEHFKLLQNLRCNNNQLTSLDVSQNTALKELNFSYNKLTSLDVSQNTALTKLQCSYNQLDSLDVRENTALKELSCSSNQLTSLDVSQDTALTYLYCYNNQLKSLDVSRNTALTNLHCYNNQLTSLDVSQNTALTYLDCSFNQLTSLDLSQGKALTELDCHYNQLTSLDLSNNKALEKLYCYSNQLTSLDLSQNTALTYLYCYSNQLTSLDLSQNTALTVFSGHNNSRTVPMYYYMENGNKVTVMPVGNDESNPLYADGFLLENASNWTNATVTEGGLLVVADTTQAVTYTYNTGLAGKNVTFTLNKSAQDGGECLLINEENFPDANFRAYVSTLQSGGDGVFTPEELAAITEVDCSSKKIASLKGVEHFKLLQNLRCYDNKLTSLDVSQNTALTKLKCDYNQLDSLDVRENTALTEFYCIYNKLTSLDVSNNTALTTLYCSHNELTSLDVSQNTALTTLLCNVNQLTSLIVSQDTALTYLQCYSNQLTSLDVSKNTALAYLQCYNNQLGSLDVSLNTALEKLHCYSNQLTSLDLSNNKALTLLYCYSNQLTSLDLSHNTALEKLHCYSNQLTSLDLSQNTALTNLNANNNSRVVSMSSSGGNYIIEYSDGASNPLYADGFRLEKASNWTNAEVRTIDGKQVLVVTDATQPVTYSYDTGNQRFPVSFTIRGCVDVNGDDKIDAADVSALINVVLGNIEGDSDACDVNGDGVVDALDVSTLIDKICGNSN